MLFELRFTLTHTQLALQLLTSTRTNAHHIASAFLFCCIGLLCTLTLLGDAAVSLLVTVRLDVCLTVCVCVCQP